ncbi:MAG: hypothetical protein KIT69_15165, partial [Propionibacteriaceae bacterium]|nr:hypothetical protein [Propionibacteriaceae bacterium]
VAKPSRPESSRPRLRVHGRVAQFSNVSETVTIDLDGLALYGVNPDGQRILVAGNGDRMVLEPGHWHKPEAIIEAIDLVVPTAVTVPLEPRPPEEVPRAPGSAERVRLLLRHFGIWLIATETGRNALLTALILLVGILVVVFTGTGEDLLVGLLIGTPLVLLVIWGGTLFRAFVSPRGRTNR